MTTPTADMIAAMCGISRKAAINRLARYARGEMSRERLLRPYSSPRLHDDDQGGNAEWQALGNTPKNELLAAIPGCTDLERRLYGITDAAPPPQPEEKKPLAQQVAQMTGVHISTARERVARFRRGDMTLRELYAPPVAEESRRLIDDVVARANCCRATASSRLRRFRIGLITEAQLYAPTTGGRK